MSKNKLSVDDVKHVAKLANLPLSDDEIRLFDSQLSETLSHAKDLDELDTKNIKPTSQVTGKENELRQDEIKPGLTQTQALQNAKSHNGFFVSKVSWN
jgi:aspartyl-tRNA(Asn)/glutamyl-tRNA(Gln) amidotransferase subunit C